MPARDGGILPGACASRAPPGAACGHARAATAATQSSVHGFHESFHLLVVLGHLASMGFDLREVASPSARTLGPWVRGVAPYNPAMLPWVLSPWLLLLAMLPNKGRIVGKLSRLLGFDPS